MISKPWRHDVAGFGNALVDSLVLLDNAEIASTGFRQGIMHVVDSETWDSVFQRFQSPSMEVHSGGSCPNTLAALGMLGARTTFRGQVGDDPLGRRYLESLGSCCEVSFMKTVAGAHTGKCLSLIRREDGERTMLTCLGTAIELQDLGDFEAEIRSSRVLHLTGYPFLQEPISQAAFRALDIARESGAIISFDVADPFVIRVIRQHIWRILRDYADIVFLNSEEASELCEGLIPEEAVHEVAATVDTVLVKLGSRGSLLKHQGVLEPIGIERVQAIDTTGAGDSFASGFLYGRAKDWSPLRSARLGARVAALTVTQLGAVFRDRNRLAQAIDACKERP